MLIPYHEGHSDGALGGIFKTGGQLDIVNGARCAPYRLGNQQ